MAKSICQACGRTTKELQEELGIEPVLFEVVGIDMCSKCESEYENGLNKDEAGSTADIQAPSKSASERWNEIMG